jgi:hypothetical protein
MRHHTTVLRPAARCGALTLAGETSPRETPVQAVFTGPLLLPKGDGSYTLGPDTPEDRLTPAQFGAHFRVKRDTVYRWIRLGIIDPKYVVPIGKRKLFIRVEAVPDCQEKFESLRE